MDNTSLDFLSCRWRFECLNRAKSTESGVRESSSFRLDLIDQESTSPVKFHMTRLNKQPEWMTPAQAAEALGVSKQRVSQLIKLGRLNAVILDGRQYINPGDVEALKGKKTTARRKKSGIEIYHVTIKATIKVERGKDEDDDNDSDG
jgi:excisionase family DNA binding protein